MVGLEGLCRSQGFHAPGPSGRFISSFACTLNRRASDCGTVFLILGQKRPDHPRVLVRHCHYGSVSSATLSQRIHPLTEPVRLANSRSHDGARTVDQQGSQMLVSAFADAHQDRSIPAGMLAWDQAEPGRHMASVFEVAAITDRSDDGGGCLRPDAADTTNPLACIVRATDLVDPTVKFPDKLINPGHQAQQVEQYLTAEVCEVIASVFEDLRNHASRFGDRPTEGDASVHGGDRKILMGISKRGEQHLRTLLVHGARAVVRTAVTKTDRFSRWVNELRERRGTNRAIVAVANKNARIIWALLAKNEEYRPAT